MEFVRNEATEEGQSTGGPSQNMKNKLQPLINSFWEEMGSADLLTHESRVALAQLFQDIVDVTSQEILADFKEYKCTLNRHQTPHVTEATMKRALLSCSFFKCGAPGSSEELMDLINMALSRSEGDRPLLAEVTCRKVQTDKTLHDKPKLKHTSLKETLSSDNWESEDGTDESAELEKGPKGKLLSTFKEQLINRCFPCACTRAKGTQDRSSAFSESSGTLPSSTDSLTSASSQDLSSDEDCTKVFLPSSLREATDAITDILEEEAEELSEEWGDQDHEDTASSIVTIVIDDLPYCDETIEESREQELQFSPPELELSPPENRVHITPQDSLSLAASSAQPPYVWDSMHIFGLVYEVVSRVMQLERLCELKCTFTDLLLQQLHSQMTQWEITIKPDVRNVRDVARAVYQELCRGRRKNWVTVDAMVREEYMYTVIEHIHKYLISPEGKLPKSSFCGRC